MQEETETPEGHHHRKFKTLYVILQGEFVLFHDRIGNELRILAPWLDGHNYKAGPWHKEEDLFPRKPLRLVHAIGGIATPQENSGHFLRLGKCDHIAGNPYIDIAAPMPIGFLAGLREDASTDFVTVTDRAGVRTQIVQPTTPTLIPILVYKWDTAYRHTPCIVDAKSRYEWQSGWGDDCLALHIYASGSETETDAHAKLAFKESASLLGFTADIDWTSIQPPTPAEPPAGLTCEQVNHFFSQRATTAEGRAQKGKVLLENPLAHATSGNCGPITHD